MERKGGWGVGGVGDVEPREAKGDGEGKGNRRKENNYKMLLNMMPGKLIEYKRKYNVEGSKQLYTDMIA